VRLGWPFHAGNIKNGVLNVDHDNCFVSHSAYCRTFLLRSWATHRASVDVFSEMVVTSIEDQVCIVNAPPASCVNTMPDHENNTNRANVGYEERYEL
jgi:hypothetical protein